MDEELCILSFVLVCMQAVPGLEDGLADCLATLLKLAARAKPAAPQAGGSSRQPHLALGDGGTEAVGEAVQNVPGAASTSAAVAAACGSHGVTRGLLDCMAHLLRLLPAHTWSIVWQHVRGMHEELCTSCGKIKIILQVKSSEVVKDKKPLRHPDLPLACMHGQSPRPASTRSFKALELHKGIYNAHASRVAHDACLSWWANVLAFDTSAHLAP